MKQKCYKQMNKVIFTLLCMTFIYSGYRLITAYSRYLNMKDIYNNASRYVNVTDMNGIVEGYIGSGYGQAEYKGTIEYDNIGESVKNGNDTPFVLNVDWKALGENVIGWIHIEGTGISYPLVQTFDNKYYLNHLYNGDYNKAGSIFVDYRNESIDDKHVIIYGHNMRDKSMFSNLKNYLEQEYADKHRQVYIAAPDGYTRECYIFSCFLTDASRDEDGYTAYKVEFNDSEWKEWIHETEMKSLISCDIDIGFNQKIITLSTCMSRGDKTERIVIHAVQIKEEHSM